MVFALVLIVLLDIAVTRRTSFLLLPVFTYPHSILGILASLKVNLAFNFL